ncbi:MAG: aminopeptidase P family protein [Desulfobacteraceae bacterium]|nr:aminopeptidase P family protein [Desulfobacteraceae bacterium]
MENKIFEKRIANLRKQIASSGLDTIIILSDENRMYLSGYTGEDGRYDETAGILVITKNDLILACDSRYNTQAEHEAPLFSVICYEKSFTKELPKILKSINASKVGFEAERLTYKTYETIMEEISEGSLDIQIGSDNNILKNLRIKKDRHEISMIKKALKISEDSFLKFKKLIKEGMSEKEAAWIFEKLMRENDADSLSFDVIAAGGENSALPHAIPGNRKFKNNEPLLFDFGVRLKGYCSDTSRTLIMGKSTDKFDQIYNIIFQAQKIAVENIMPGIKASTIDKIARDYIDNTEFTGKFGHGLGHGVGIVIHEAPRLSKFDDTLLEPGMIVTVEPGIYVPRWGGIRLENMIEVTENGANVLNTLSYDDYLI